jgi:hypothetical protein
MMNDDLAGKKHVFEDGSVIEVLQIKMRDNSIETVPIVTYTVQQGRSLPRKLVLPLNEFINTFGHLFGEDNGL